MRSGTVAVDGTELDFRSARRVGEAKLDNGYTDLERDDAGVARISRRGPTGRGRTLWVDEGYPYVMVFTGDIPSVRASWARGRADDLSSERVPQRRRLW